MGCLFAVRQVVILKLFNKVLTVVWWTGIDLIIMATSIKQSRILFFQKSFDILVFFLVRVNTVIGNRFVLIGEQKIDYPLVLVFRGLIATRMVGCTERLKEGLFRFVFDLHFRVGRKLKFSAFDSCHLIFWIYIFINVHVCLFFSGYFYRQLNFLFKITNQTIIYQA